MSAPENQDSRGRLLTYLFWGGIGLAALAALVLIAVGSSTSGLRFAAILIVLSVVAIGISITLRRDASSIKVDLEETLLDEIDMLRGDVRADITTAARATHRSLSERVAALQESLEQMRHQVESAEGPEIERMTTRPPIGPPPGMRAVAAVPAGPAGPNGHAGPGVVHRTETVRVTTRTIVDPDEDPYARNHPARPAIEHSRDIDSHERQIRDRRSEPRDEQPPGRYTDEDRHRDSHGSEASPRRPSDFEVAARRAWSDTSDDLGDDPRWAGMQAGDRWAEVRQDEHGREVRMAERRAAIRTDETGTHLRVVDRWSTIREDHPHTESNDEYQTGGETRAQRRAREAAERDEWGQPSGGRRSAPERSPEGDGFFANRRPELPSAAPKRSADEYQSFTPRPLEYSSRDGRRGAYDDRRADHDERRGGHDDRGGFDDARDERAAWEEPSQRRRSREEPSEPVRPNGFWDDSSHSRRSQQEGQPSEAWDEPSRHSRSSDESSRSSWSSNQSSWSDRSREPRSRGGASAPDNDAESRSWGAEEHPRSWSAEDRPRSRAVDEEPRSRRRADEDRADRNGYERSHAYDGANGRGDRIRHRQDGHEPSDHSGSDYSRDDYARDDYGRDDYGRDDYGRSDYGRADDSRGRVQHSDGRRDHDGGRQHDGWSRQDSGRDDRSDDRWEREPSGGRLARPRQYGFEVNDERWH